MPASATAPLITSLRSWASVLLVWRSIGEMLQPMIAMSSGLLPGFLAISGHPVHEVGVVHVGLTGGDPTDEPALGAGIEVGALALRGPHGRHLHADAHVVDGHVDEGLEAEHHVDAVELDVNAGEPLGLRLARVLDRLDERVVRDHARL